MTAQLFAGIFGFAIVLTFATQWWLAARQARCVREHAGAVPAAFAEKISLADHAKAAAYTVDKLRLSLAASAVSIALVTVLTFCGVVGKIWNWALALTGSPLWSGILLFAIVSLLGEIVGLPAAWIGQFRIEERYGFNRQTTHSWIADQAKGLAVSLVLMAVVLVPILLLWQSAGPLWWLWAWGVYIATSLILMLVYPVVIAPIFNKFQPMEDGELKTRLEALLSRIGFAAKGLYVMDGSRRSSHGNAYFTGFGKSRRIVLFDTLIAKLSPEELEAVLAHELGHFKLHHILIRMVIIFAMSLAVFALLGWLAGENWFFEGLGAAGTSGHREGLALTLFAICQPYFTFLAAPVTGAFSRLQEYQADAFAVRATGPQALSRGLVKLFADNAATLTPDPIYSAFYSSHPPAALRIAAIEKAGALHG